MGTLQVMPLAPSIGAAPSVTCAHAGPEAVPFPQYVKESVVLVPAGTYVKVPLALNVGATDGTPGYTGGAKACSTKIVPVPVNGVEGKSSCIEAEVITLPTGRLNEIFEKDVDIISDPSEGKSKITWPTPGTPVEY